MPEKLSRQQRRALERKQNKKTLVEKRTGFSAEEIFDLYEYGRTDLTSETKVAYDKLRAEHDQNKKGFWLPEVLAIKIAGRFIDGLVYFGEAYPVEVNGELQTPKHLFINPNLEVAKSVGDSKGKFISDAIAYDKMEPVDRANYLDWLATGRKDTSYDMAYLQLYFRGLEFRYFMDNSNQDEKSEIAKEIARLVTTFRPYSLFFQDFVRFASLNEVPTNFFDIKDQTIFWRPELTNLIEGGIFARENKPVKSNQIYYTVSNSENTKFAEMRQYYPYLFQKLFEEKLTKLHPEGQKITPPKECLQNIYHSLFGDFTFVKDFNYLGKKIPDIRFCSDINELANDLANSTAKDLADYCHEIDETIENFYDQNQIVFRPESDRNLATFPADEIVKDWIVEHNKNPESFTANDAANFFNHDTDIHTSSKPWFRMVAMLERAGYGIAPDYGLFNCSTWPNNPMVIYQLESSLADRAKCTNRYNTEFLSIYSGITLFRSKEKIPGELLRIIEDQIDIEKKLTVFEKERLLANFEWFKKNRIGNNYVSFMNLFVRAESTKELRKTIKYYVEKGKINIREKLQMIVALYNSQGINASHVVTDFELTGKLREECLTIEQAIKHKVEDLEKKK